MAQQGGMSPGRLQKQQAHVQQHQCRLQWPAQHQMGRWRASRDLDHPEPWPRRLQMVAPGSQPGRLKDNLTAQRRGQPGRMMKQAARRQQHCNKMQSMSAC